MVLFFEKIAEWVKTFYWAQIWSSNFLPCAGIGLRDVVVYSVSEPADGT